MAKRTSQHIHWPLAQIFILKEMKHYSLTIFCTLCLFCPTIPSFSQDYIEYYNLINEAEYQILLKNDSVALTYYKKAFNCEKPHAKDLYVYALCLKRLNHSNNIKPLLVKSARNYGKPSYWLFKESQDYQFKKSYIKKLRNIENKNRLKTKIIMDTVDYFMLQDQLYRKVFVDSIKVYYSKTDTEYIEFMEKYHEHDSLYQVEFLNYVKENGFPGSFTIGSDKAASILFHIICPNFKIAKDLLYQELLKGNILPFYYALMVDRIGYICNGKAYYYAYPLNKDCLPERDEILENRKKIGASIYFQGPRRFTEFSRNRLLEESLKNDFDSFQYQ